MLLDELKVANVEALKNRDKEARGILSVVLTKCKNMEVEYNANKKPFGDAEVLSIIQKCLKELNDEKEGYLKVNNLERADTISKQEEFLKKYLPQQLTKEEILEEIGKLEDKSMPSIMKHFKMNFAGKVDMSLVSQIARSL